MNNLIKKFFDLNKLLRSFFVAVIPALLFFAFSLLVLKSQGFATADVLRDPARLREESSFMGFLSNMGVWLWVGSTSICFFAFFSRDFKEVKKLKEFLFLTGSLSLILAVDDFFIIHDQFISHLICYPFYAFFVMAMLVRHFKLIIEIDGIAFILACSLLGSSMLIDLLRDLFSSHFSSSFLRIIEEGFKFIGAAVWLYFNYGVASYRTEEVIANKP